MKSTHATKTRAGFPVAIGGVGGSGTRLFAELLQRLGFSIGSDLNPALDNLWFTLLFKRPAMLSAPDHEFEWLLRLFVARMKGELLGEVERSALRNYLARDTFRGAEHTSEWRQDRIETFLSEIPQTQPRMRRWGWKEPNTHLFASRLLTLLPELRYIHIIRNGLDMAYSSNQNQLRLWGSTLLGRECEVGPRDSLKYWCEVHRRLLSVQERFSDRFLMLHYDKFIDDPNQELKRMFRFLGVSDVTSSIPELMRLIRPSIGTGRYNRQGLELFDPCDIEFVRSMGFETESHRN